MADQFFESVIGFNIGGNYAAVVHHWVGDDSGGQTAFEMAELLATALETDAGASSTLFDLITAIMADDSFISSIRTRRLSSGGGATYAKLFASTDWVGVFGGPSDSAGVAGCMLKFTSTNPKLQGRTFWPGVSEDALLDGRFTDAYVLAFFGLTERFIDTFTETVTFSPRLKHGAIPSYTALSALELSPTPGTIRRRLVPV